METASNRSQREITMVDAGTLNDEQFGTLVESLETRNWFIPALMILMVTVAGISQIT